jgi:hypothetical protein
MMRHSNGLPVIISMGMAMIEGRRKLLPRVHSSALRRAISIKIEDANLSAIDHAA